MILRLVFLASMVLATTSCDGFFERTTSWKEEVVLSDGSTLLVSRSITRGSDQWFRPGQGGTVRSTIAASVPRLGEIEFLWNGYEIPVAFDIVAGTPWVVLPIAGLESCEKYGNPAESVVAFSWKNGQWSWQPFATAPRDLKQNLLRSAPFNREPVVKIASKRSYSRNDGVALTKGFIPQHVKWEHACYRINPPPDPSYQRSIQEYEEKARIPLAAKVVEARDDVISLTLEEDRSMMGPPTGRSIIGCQGKVSRMESIFSTRRHAGGGGTTGTLTAWRIALAPGGAAARSIFLPARARSAKTEAGRLLFVARIVCSESLIYVVLREESAVFSVVAYDLGGSLTHAWRIHTPELGLPDNRMGSVFDFRDHGDRFTMSIGEYRHNSGQSGLPVATLGKRFSVEAIKP